MATKIIKKIIKKKRKKKKMIRIWVIKIIKSNKIINFIKKIDLIIYNKMMMKIKKNKNPKN